MPFEIYISPYKIDLIVYTHRKEYEKVIVKLGGSPLKVSCHATTSLLTLRKDGSRRIMMFLPKNCTPGVLAHECLHAIDFIWESRGIQFDLINDEPAAYLLEFLVDTISDKLRK